MSYSILFYFIFFIEKTPEHKLKFSKLESNAHVMHDYLVSSRQFN